MMRKQFDGLVIVEEDYLKQLEDFRKSFAYLPGFGLDKLTHKDIVNIDTYKDSFVRLLEIARLSTANQRALNIGEERELMGLINGLGLLIQDVKDIDKVREKYEKETDPK